MAVLHAGLDHPAKFEAALSRHDDITYHQVRIHLVHLLHGRLAVKAEHDIIIPRKKYPEIIRDINVIIGHNDCRLAVRRFLRRLAAASLRRLLDLVRQSVGLSALDRLFLFLGISLLIFRQDEREDCTAP